MRRTVDMAGWKKCPGCSAWLKEEWNMCKKCGWGTKDKAPGGNGDKDLRIARSVGIKAVAVLASSSSLLHCDSIDDLLGYAEMISDWVLTGEKPGFKKAEAKP